MAETAKSLNVTNMTEARQRVDDIEVHGNPGKWVCVCKASSKKQDWMKSTKVYELPDGCLVQVTTQQGNLLAEALEFVPGARLADFG